MERRAAAWSIALPMRAPILRARLVACVTGFAGGCAADPVEDGADSTTTSTTLSSSATDPTGTATNASTTSVATTESGSEASTLGSEADTGSSTGAPDTTVVLQNDAFVPTRGLFWQTWPSPGDCWASTYAIDEGLYPFEIVGVEVAIGGAATVASFELGIWELDDEGLPAVAIDTVMVDVEGDMQGPDLDVASLLEIPVFDSGSFAVVMCHVDHMGSPSIGTDLDATVDADHNFVYQGIMGEWVPSPDFFGIDGDFVMRAVVQPL